MALPIYLAMTAWEMENKKLPPRCGWMACHFSAYGQGLSNIPHALPADALLIVNDRIPPWEHDPSLIAQQLQEMITVFSPRGVLLDFQRPYNKETAQIAAEVSKLPCPVATTELYAGDCDSAVFLPPVPLNKPLQAHLSPWQGRQIWLEIDLSDLTMTVTQEGCRTTQDPAILAEPIFADTKLHCHYSISQQQDQAVFSLTRQQEDLSELLQEAEELGVTLAAGLYQELSPVLFVHGAT